MDSVSLIAQTPKFNGRERQDEGTGCVGQEGGVGHISLIFFISFVVVFA